MTRVRIRGGYLNIGRRTRPGGGGPVDPDYGVDEGDIGGGGDIDEGSPPGIDNELPSPPPGIWPPLTPEHPWRPLPSWPERPSHPIAPGTPPAGGVGGRPPDRPQPGEPDEELPPGSIWPPLPPSVHGKFLALVLIAGTGHGAHYRYVVVDADARPEHPIAPGQPIPPREPKR
jgi:hypothetical protein